MLHRCIDRATSHLNANAGSPALSCAALHVGTCELHLNCLVHAPLLQRRTAALASLILSGSAMRHCVDEQRRHESQNMRAVSSMNVWSNAAAVMGRPAPAWLLCSQQSQDLAPHLLCLLRKLLGCCYLLLRLLQLSLLPCHLRLKPSQLLLMQLALVLGSLQLSFERLPLQCCLPQLAFQGLPLQ